MKNTKFRRRLVTNISKLVRSNQSQLSNTRQHLHLKSQPTSDSLKPYENKFTNQQTYYSNRYQALPRMLDDFKQRQVIYKQSFVLKKNRIVKLQFSKSKKFMYITIYDVKCDLHYKLRLTIPTGQYILDKIKMSNQKFRDYLQKDEQGHFSFKVIFKESQRKFEFTKYQPSIFKDSSEQYDEILKQAISQIDRTEQLFGIHFKQ